MCTQVPRPTRATLETPRRGPCKSATNMPTKASTWPSRNFYRGNFGMTLRNRRLPPSASHRHAQIFERSHPYRILRREVYLHHPSGRHRRLRSRREPCRSHVPSGKSRTVKALRAHRTLHRTDAKKKKRTQARLLLEPAARRRDHDRKNPAATQRRRTRITLNFAAPIVEAPLHPRNLTENRQAASKHEVGNLFRCGAKM